MFSVEAWRTSSGDLHQEDEPDGDPDHIPDLTTDSPAASRQRSRSSQTAVEHDSTDGSNKTNGDSKDSSGSGEKGSCSCALPWRE